MSLMKKNELFLLEEIIKKNFSSKYKDSFLGIFWTILSPLLLMALFTIIFSTLFSRNIENFPIYFLSGWCLYMFFNYSTNNSMYALKGNKNILQRTPTSKYIFILGAVLSEFLNFLIMMAILFIVMIVTHATVNWITLPFIIIPILSLLISLVGLGLIFSIACVYYSDIKHLWSVITLMVMYASAIFYPMDIIPEPYHSYLILNPLYWAIDQFRCFIYLGTFPQLQNIINLFLLSLIILVLGIIVFKKYENKVTMKL